MELIQGMCWAWMSPAWGHQAWLPQWVRRGTGLLSSSRSKGVRVPLCSVAGTAPVKQEGSSTWGSPIWPLMQQHNFPTSKQHPKTLFPRPLREADLIPQGFKMGNKKILST